MKIKTRKALVISDFVAVKLRASVELLFKRLRVPLVLTFAPYGNVTQQLTELRGRTLHLDLLVILLRLECDRSQNRELYRSVMQTSIQIISSSIKQICGSASGPHVIVINCQEKQRFSDLRLLEEGLGDNLEAIHNCSFWSIDEQCRKYPASSINDYFDDDTREEDTPYSPLYFAVLGVILARTAHSLWMNTKKVIVVDCDDTLWDGQSAELGAVGVTVTNERAQIQSALVQQRKNGKVLCICSKNDLQSVMAVFEKNPDMILRACDVTAWRVNWRPKYKNVQSLSSELNISVDAFIFIDNDLFECESMRASLPTVQTLQLPASRDMISEFLEGIWAFDSSAVTPEDSKRADYYRDQNDRMLLQNTATSYDQFVRELALEVRVRSLTETSLFRAAQLTQRVNQFSLNGIRYSTRDLWELSQQSTCETIHVTDRIGDYGLVGVLIYNKQGGKLDVTGIYLSCRVLGRGVEVQLINHIVAVGQCLQTAETVFSYRETTYNMPINDFLGMFNQMARSADI